MALSPGLERILLRATTAFVDLEDGILPDPAETGTPARLRAMVSQLPRDQVLLLHVGGWVLHVVSLIRWRRPFHHLTDRQARRLLRRLADSRWSALRRLVHVIKMMTQFAYFAGEASWSFIAYDGPWLGRVEVETLPPPRIDGEGSA